jgi:hypothetical protein
VLKYRRINAFVGFFIHLKKMHGPKCKTGLCFCKYMSVQVYVGANIRMCIYRHVLAKIACQCFCYDIIKLNFNYYGCKKLALKFCREIKKMK